MRKVSAAHFYLAGLIAVLSAGCASSTSPLVPSTAPDTSAPNSSETVVPTSPETTQPADNLDINHRPNTDIHRGAGSPASQRGPGGSTSLATTQFTRRRQTRPILAGRRIDPSGNIFISGHDHVENSMLYRLDETTGMLNWVGDARSASEQVDN